MQLGIIPGEIYEETDFQLDHGDLVLLSTDGITEARNGSLFLELEGLQQLANVAYSLGSLDKIGGFILDKTREFAGGKLRDDACIVLARRL